MLQARKPERRLRTTQLDEPVRELIAELADERASADTAAQRRAHLKEVQHDAGGGDSKRGSATRLLTRKLSWGKERKSSLESCASPPAAAGAAGGSATPLANCSSGGGGSAGQSPRQSPRLSAYQGRMNAVGDGAEGRRSISRSIAGALAPVRRDSSSAKMSETSEKGGRGRSSTATDGANPAASPKGMTGETWERFE